MGRSERDVVIVGGGHNGLACATYLAKAGLDVLVLERRDILGGAAVTEEPWPGYRISSASYVVSLMPQRIVDELELKRFGYEVSIITPDYFVPFPDGTSLTLWGDIERDAENIAKLSPHDAEAYVEFDRLLRAGRRADEGAAVRGAAEHAAARRRRVGGTAGRFRGWTGRDIHELVRLFTMSAADFLDEWFEDQRVKGALATQAIIGAWCGPMTPGSAYVLMHHWIGEIDGHFGAWGWVKGGMGGVTRPWRARPRPPARRSGRTRRCAHRDQQPGPGGGRGARRRLADPREARRVQRAPEDDVPGPGRRGSPARRRGARRPAVPHAHRLGEDEPRAVGAARVYTPGTRRATCTAGSWRLAQHGVPRAGLRRREVRPGEGASVRRGHVPDGARARPGAGRQAHHDGVHAVRALRAARGSWETERDAYAHA